MEWEKGKIKEKMKKISIQKQARKKNKKNK